MARAALQAVLAELRLTQYHSKLDGEAVDMEAILLLSATDLRSVIGLPLGHAAKLIDRARNAKVGIEQQSRRDVSTSSAGHRNPAVKDAFDSIFDERNEDVAPASHAHPAVAGATTDAAEAPHVAMSEAEQTVLSDSPPNEEQKPAADEMFAATHATEAMSQRTVAGEARGPAADASHTAQERTAPAEPVEANLEVTQLDPEAHDERHRASDAESFGTSAAAGAEVGHAAVGRAELAGHGAAEGA